ncbi:methyltransferase domain-containing protein [Isoptericola chiayiensis]|uniref:Methyltransferase domain-containing protein n=1 Tax=Isoptericola chiayiensis TaxID=579446 RepID=A0ABP8YTW1_9MICO|nr:methyltransferase domain-containing protein [Isoptericola chiayiensis]NOW01846.1 ubiquinone/menaquinone biosynthesis C-methylase UbiE [Isoptericola chiayiensis]
MSDQSTASEPDFPEPPSLGSPAEGPTGSATDEPSGAALSDAIEAPSSHQTVPSQESESYTHGHHESVLRAHRARTAQNSAGFLLPHLKDDLHLLDVGCGPGTVTTDLARVLAGGKVVGVDASATVLEAAQSHADALGARNVRFEQANAYELPFDDDTFDVVYAHQLLQHLSDPVAALREMKRVARPGGLVAVRDADYAAMAWYPESPGLTEWNTLYHEVTRAYGFEPDAGRRLFSWVQQAGFDVAGTVPSASSWCYATPTDREWWGQVWAERCVESNFARQAQESNLADDVALEQLAHDWQSWAQAPDGWFAILHGEVLARA